MTSIPTSTAAHDYTFTPDDVNFRLVTGPTEDALAEFGPRQAADYRDFKEEYVGWFLNVGKKPNKGVGYSPRTVEQLSMKTDQIFRWMWLIKEGYYTQMTPDDADKLMKSVERADFGNANILTFKKSVVRYFKWLKHEKDTDYTDWDCPIEASEKERTQRDYFRRHEFDPLYNAALDYRSVKPYENCTPEERDQYKATLAQRFELPKTEIGPDHFRRANSWKVPSLVGATLDCGLRPVEIEKANLGWVNLSDHTLDIPPKEATKSDEEWKVSLSTTTVRALERWLDEREANEKYDGTDTLWLNRVGNPYNSRTLNYFLPDLIDAAGIDRMGRDLTWYSIRHGVATLWANEYGIQHAREQLRHEKIETTMRYVHSDSETRNSLANDAW